jgi:AraC-like DNA-binding protein
VGRILSETIEVVRRSTCPGVEIFNIGHSSHAWGHINGAFAFGSMWSWQGQLDYRRRNHDLCAGSTFLFDPGEFFQSTPFEGRPGSFRVIEISPESFQTLCRREGARGPIHFGPTTTKATPALTHALNGLQAALAQEAEPLEVQAWLAAIAHGSIASVLERTLQVTKTFSPLGPCEQLRELLHSPDGTDINLGDFAERAGVSQFQLLRAFKRRYGSPPHAYGLHVRIQRARHMLRGGCTVAEAAAANDFTDQSHFTRHFRRIFAVTPGQYAAAPR